jgi:hypothetical protein
MKTMLKAMLVCGALMLALPVDGAPAAGQETPVGRLVEVQLVAWPLSTAPAGLIRGTLVAMTTGWLVIKEGSYEHWVPMEKVMSMRVSR